MLATVGVGVLAGLLVPYRDLGLAFFLVLVAAGGTVWWAAQHRRDPFTLTCLVLAALCTLPVVLLDAEWIVALCLVAGTACLLVGVTRGHRLVEFVAAGLAWPLAALRGQPWLSRSLRGVLGRGHAPERAADGRLVGPRGAGLRAALRLRRRGRRRLGWTGWCPT